MAGNRISCVMKDKAGFCPTGLGEMWCRFGLMVLGKMHSLSIRLHLGLAQHD